MKKLVMVGLIVSLFAGFASADPAARINKFAKGSIPAFQMWSNEVPDLVAAGWTDDAVIATGNPAAINWALDADNQYPGQPMSDEFAIKLAAYVSALESGVGRNILALTMFPRIPITSRKDFKTFIDAKVASVYPGQPVRVAFLQEKVMTSPVTGWGVPDLLNNTAAAGKPDLLRSATIEELIELRLAHELRSTDEAVLILEKASVGAKKALRAEGKSFVAYTEVVNGVTNVVNPLTLRMAPVVDAVNAPLMVGLEEALATCGITIPKQDVRRAAIAALSDQWKNAILDGEVEPAQNAPYLAALKVTLGLVEYNKMIEAYNGKK